MRGSVAVTLLLVLGVSLAACIGEGESNPVQEASTDPAPTGPTGADVVIAQFDTGTNPFHPCFRRPGWDASQAKIPGFPADAQALHLSFEEDYQTSLDASEEAIKAVEKGVLYHIPETNLLFYGEPEDLVDTYPHGTQASSQVVCEEFGMAPDAWLVVVNWYRDTATINDNLAWAAHQDWIDLVHLNIQDFPFAFENERTRRIQGLIDAGQLVVIAAGNGVAGAGANYPMEVSRYNGPPGSLIAGANDNNGYTVFSNLNPHVVMSGCGTRAAEATGFGNTSFSGTSSASPRITGYAAVLLQQARNAMEAEPGREGDALLQLAENATTPEQGPLNDGRLTVAELHEVIRKTANANPHDSEYNGAQCLPGVWWVPQPADSPVAVYPKMGYGQVSEHTLVDARAVIVGDQPLPERPVEDAFYEQSEGFRERYWG